MIIDLKSGNASDKPSRPTVLVLGNFDGVHKGHLRLIGEAVELSRKNGLDSAAWTFAEHPQLLLNAKKTEYLTDTSEKNIIFAKEGLDYAIYEDFALVKDMTPEDFVKNILIDSLDCRAAVCGFNFRFGKNGSGNAELLQTLMKAHNRDAVVIPPVYIDGGLVSSTAIRALIEDGKTEEASRLLGRPYSVTLPVVEGKRLGRTIGLPTINQSFPQSRIRPKNGIYACTCLIDGKVYRGVSNVGSRPTVNDDSSDVNCETHIIGYEGWLYGQSVTVSFYKRLRDEKRFPDLDLLKSAVENDVAACLDYFSKNEGI